MQSFRNVFTVFLDPMAIENAIKMSIMIKVSTREGKMAFDLEPELHDHKSAHALLEVAIQIAQQGDKVEARHLLRSFLENHPENERAWAWYVDTFADDEKRLRILQVYLKQNPQSQFAQQAIRVLRNKMHQAVEASDKVAAGASIFTEEDGWPAMFRLQDTSAQFHEETTTHETDVQPAANTKNNETRLLIIATLIILATIALAVVWSLVH